MDRKSEILTKYGSRLLIERSKAEMQRSESKDIEKAAMDRKSEILTKYGSRLLINRSKGHLAKSESRNIETSAMKRKSELLTKYGSRMLANSKVFQRRASSRFRRMSYKRLSLLPEIPTSGTALLEWTRNNMSFISTSELSVVSSVEDTTTEEVDLASLVSTERKLSKRKGIEIKDEPVKERKSPKQKKLKKSTTNRRSYDKEADVFDNTNLIRGLEDEIMTLFRKRKEEESLQEKIVHSKSEVTFSESNEPQTKTKKVVKRKKRRKAVKKAKKTAMELKLLEEQRAAEELAKQAELEALHQRLLLKRAQDEEEENMGRERNLLLKKKIQKVDGKHLKNVFEKERKEEWMHYINCVKVPEITKFDQLTLFVHKLELEFDEMSIQEVTDKIGTNLQLLDDLDEVKYQLLHDDHERISKLNWVIGILRKVQWATLERIVYRILLDINDNMVIDNLDYATFHHKSDYFILSLWLKQDWPISLPNPKKPSSPKVSIALPQVDVDVTLPPSLRDHKSAIMCYYLPYDHMSDSCSTYRPPIMSDFVKKDLLETNLCDRTLKNKYEYECYQRSQYIEKVVEHQTKHGSEKYPTPFVLLEETLEENIPLVPVQNLSPTADEYLEIAEVLQTRKLDYIEYHADFPSHIPRSMSVYTSTSAKLSGKIKRLSRRSTRRAGKLKMDQIADSDELQSLKEMENMWIADMEAKKENLIVIRIRLPENIVYLEKPIICMWNEHMKVWETTNIYDAVHEDKDKKITFLATEFGIFGLAVRRYLNFPYRHWDIRPKSANSIAVTLVGAKVEVHLDITEWNIQITHLEYTDGGIIASDWLLSKVMTLPKLVKTLRLCGLDLFPDYDANCYYKDTSEKHWAMSYTTYYSMAMMAAVHNFASSKWNSRRNRRSVVLKVREFDHAENMNLLEPYLLIHITPLRCQPLICTEDDEVFFDEPPESYKFQPNLFHLLKSMVGTTNRARLKQFSQITVHTLAQFLVQSRILSFS
ncbi:hypothetical protein WA026_005138 [Henosepilachna vigintioctopunctata]|uniref:Uncharacterized protein n=1 Tax=Henosepilachna vigintioctopunctata TaxID=420089 RepID=A0AAW1UNS8_9CUCU